MEAEKAVEDRKLDASLKSRVGGSEKKALDRARTAENRARAAEGRADKLESAAYAALYEIILSRHVACHAFDHASWMQSETEVLRRKINHITASRNETLASRQGLLDQIYTARGSVQQTYFALNVLIPKVKAIKDFETDRNGARLQLSAKDNEMASLTTSHDLAVSQLSATNGELSASQKKALSQISVKDSEITELTATLYNTQTELSIMQAEVYDLERYRVEALAQIYIKDTEIDISYDKFRDQISAKDAELSSLTTQHEAALSELSTHQQTIANLGSELSAKYTSL
ncbi:hypothetical protein BCR34DRAFT_602179 [Clohesyomyces aquaticus]|uniref:Uncharacterized protein n=1 Tax=Clohesyomyces aquaticus TaxID=1231657 RepID=A0A1Y1ZJB5_9PLEO|nr:hypothetical protein BCR34DRAFT_602179 [Clohesyomyces aquaticus]